MGTCDDVSSSTNQNYCMETWGVLLQIFSGAHKNDPLSPFSVWFEIRIKNFLTVGLSQLLADFADKSRPQPLSPLLLHSLPWFNNLFISSAFRDLRFNRIKEIQPGAFRRLKNLNTL